MIYKEQLFTRTTRIYYHGSDKIILDKSTAVYPWFFVTSNFDYAMAYAKDWQGQIGYVHSFRLKNEINIFSAQSSFDLYKLHKYCKDNNIEILVSDSDLAKNDWARFPKNQRVDIVSAIKSLGYIGFFSYEYTNSYHGPKKKHDNPSIGLFNIDCLEPLDIISYKDFPKYTEHFQSIKKDDLISIDAKYPEYRDMGFTDEEAAYVIFHDFVNVLTKNDVIERINQIKNNASTLNSNIKKDENGKLYVVKKSDRMDYKHYLESKEQIIKSIKDRLI